MGTRQRYRLIDIQQLGSSLGMDTARESFSHRYLEEINVQIRKNEWLREPAWTEGLAVGSEPYLKSISDGITGRKTLRSEPYSAPGGKGWVLRETGPHYA